MTDLDTLSNTARDLHRVFDAERGYSITIPASEVVDLANRLSLLAQLAKAMEIELAAHRVGEANRARCTVSEELATEVLRDAVTEANGKVIRPNFNRKPRRT